MKDRHPTRHPAQHVKADRGQNIYIPGAPRNASDFEFTGRGARVHGAEARAQMHSAVCRVLEHRGMNRVKHKAWDGLCRTSVDQEGQT